jgi:drug/metabolite transporter (DMT)-like permease
MKTALIIALIVTADSFGDLLLAKGMRQVGEISACDPRQWLRVAQKVARNHHVLASLLFMVMHFVGFLALLSWADLSLVFPATALVYVTGTLAAKFFLGEAVTMHRWAGTMLVCAGVGLVSLP